ncbi:MAG: hypothetical protein EOM77_03075 [Bacteroidia bacterium]|nr:hypothetical protein [Bacteroidia bacterium]
MKKTPLISLLVLVMLTASCSPNDSSSANSSDSGISPWDGKRITYSAENISSFGSATPSGVANYDEVNDQAIIWNTDASLDNYGGVQTPMLALDFSKAVVFEMDVISCYSQYVIKLAVEGVNETFYVLADEGDTGLISVNVVDSMLSEKFANRRTSPDPGYENGWLYNNMSKKCSFHILAKGPDGERQTAELVLGHLSIYNDMAAITGVDVQASGLVGDSIAKLKSSQSVTLNGAVLPSSTENQTVLWSSDDERIASITDAGVLSFNNVGKTIITAKSVVDQSKYKRINVSVLSGFENPQTLKTELSSLTYGGSNNDAARFGDLFATTWGENITQTMTSEAMNAVDNHPRGDINVFENYFDKNNASYVSEAQSHRNGNIASFNLFLTSLTNATVYRLIDGKLYQETYNSSLKVRYAEYGTVWNHINHYQEYAIVVASSGNVSKYALDVIPASLVGDFYPSDLIDAGQWTIPDRSKDAEDHIVHSLSPASLRVSGDIVYLKQNKYPESKYCFGGIVSNMMNIEQGQEMTMLLDVASLNQQSDYVKTMWEIKIIYYAEGGFPVVNANPLKVMSGNTIGLHELTFTPAYRYFRIYLVVNGSDIGAQFSDAEMGLRSFKMYALR